MKPQSTGSGRTVFGGARRRLQETAPYQLAHEIRLLQRRRRASQRESRVISLRPDGPVWGHVLLSYKLDPFLAARGTPISNRHSQDGESVLMAQTFLDLGYAVDVISFRNGTFVPTKSYAFFIDVRWNLQRLAPLLGPQCHKILHIDVCHILYQNVAEGARLLALQQRRGVTLQPRRFEWPNLAIEHADCATILGNDFTQATFAYAHKPLHPVPIVPSNVFPWPEGKDFESTRKNFLWFGSGGLVRKGLDLVLEVFARLPEHHLTICGPVADETDFVETYRRELYELPNIETVGWVDIDGARFADICRRSAFLIFPSCAEGQCGSVVVAMQAGVIPIVSYETGVDVAGRGFLLPGCELEQIEQTVREVSSLPAAVLEQSARAAWQYAREHHSREAFARTFRAVIDRLLTGKAAAAVGAPENVATSETSLVPAGDAGFEPVLSTRRRTAPEASPVSRLLALAGRTLQRVLGRDDAPVALAPVATPPDPAPLRPGDRSRWIARAFAQLRSNRAVARRPSVALGILQSVALALLFGVNAISALEFGVPDDDGVLAIEAAAILAEQQTGVRVRIHGSARRPPAPPSAVPDAGAHTLPVHPREIALWRDLFRHESPPLAFVSCCLENVDDLPAILRFVSVHSMHCIPRLVCSLRGLPMGVTMPLTASGEDPDPLAPGFVPLTEAGDALEPADRTQPWTAELYALQVSAQPLAENNEAPAPAPAASSAALSTQT